MMSFYSLIIQNYIPMARYSISHSKKGFTMIEIIVMLGIVTGISTVVLFSFGGLTGATALNRSIRELALNIRKVQNMSLAVTKISTTQGFLAPPAVGVFLTDDSSSYFFFADMPFSSDPRDRDNRYDGELFGIDGKVHNSDRKFERKVTINSLLAGSAEPLVPYQIIHIIFSAPESDMIITDENGNSVGNTLEIQLTTPTGATKKVIVRTTGQVSIK